MAEIDRPLTTDQAAKQSGFSLKTVYRAIHDGELLASKVRSRWLIAPEDLATWLRPTSQCLPDGQRVTLMPAAPAERGSLASLRAIEDEAA